LLVRIFSKIQGGGGIPVLRTPLCIFFKDYIAGGTLKNIIHDLSISLTWLQRLRYAKDIAAGMVKY
jgi:hypothetical protein